MCYCEVLVATEMFLQNFWSGWELCFPAASSPIHLLFTAGFDSWGSLPLQVLAFCHPAPPPAPPLPSSYKGPSMSLRNAIWMESNSWQLLEGTLFVIWDLWFLHSPECDWTSDAATPCSGPWGSCAEGAPHSAHLQDLQPSPILSFKNNWT